MINIYEITLKEQENKRIKYTSVEALYSAHGKEVIGVLISRVYRALQTSDIYENNRVIIEKSLAFNRNDVKAGKDKM